jgi:hypothetical protein
LLGGRLAQRQAALREMMAAGALSTFAWGLCACRLSLEQIACHGENFCGTSRQFNFKVCYQFSSCAEYFGN